MPHYVCDFIDDSNWQKTKEEVKTRTFDTEESAKEWFKAHFPGKNLEFTGFHRTERYATSWVDCDDKSIGEITRRPNEEEKYFTSHNNSHDNGWQYN